MADPKQPGSQALIMCDACCLACAHCQNVVLASLVLRVACQDLSPELHVLASGGVGEHGKQCLQQGHNTWRHLLLFQSAAHCATAVLPSSTVANAAQMSQAPFSHEKQLPRHTQLGQKQQLQRSLHWIRTQPLHSWDTYLALHHKPAALPDLKAALLRLSGIPSNVSTHPMVLSEQLSESKKNQFTMIRAAVVWVSVELQQTET